MESSSAQNEAGRNLVMRFATELYNQRRLELADELFLPDLRFHTHVRPGPEGLASGVEGLREALVWIQTGWPDSTITIEEVIADGDRAAARFTFRGTHLGVLHGNPATGRQASWPEMFFVHVRDGRIAEMWHELNVLGIGVIPPLWQMGRIPRPMLELMKIRKRVGRRLPGRGDDLSSWRENLPARK